MLVFTGFYATVLENFFVNRDKTITILNKLIFIK